MMENSSKNIFPELKPFFVVMYHFLPWVHFLRNAPFTDPSTRHTRFSGAPSAGFVRWSGTNPALWSIRDSIFHWVADFFRSIASSAQKAPDSHGFDRAVFHFFFCPSRRAPAAYSRYCCMIAITNIYSTCFSHVTSTVCDLYM